jgi:hypothetical protein
MQYLFYNKSFLVNLLWAVGSTKTDRTTFTQQTSQTNTATSDHIMEALNCFQNNTSRKTRNPNLKANLFLLYPSTMAIQEQVHFNRANHDISVGMVSKHVLPVARSTNRCLFPGGPQRFILAKASTTSQFSLLLNGSRKLHHRVIYLFTY